MNTLIINAHPDFENENSFSFKLKEMFLDKYKESFSIENLEIINLYDMVIPRIDRKELLSIWDKKRSNSELTEKELELSIISDDLLKQFKNANRIVIVSPLHNFNITSQLKDYIDNILIARETFKYTENGSVGLMTNNYKALLLQASGSIYTNNDRYTSLEFSYQYLKGMFEEIMGFDNLYIVRAQGTAILNEKEVLKDAEQELSRNFAKFYSK
ncbi:NAD(P)H-dependent oxidoreductase [Staphylococcus chromogenes]|uniref:FMN-dependent NADH-azoreductase n=1 Tax=Staphylococcus chromogenes TaxID=46126 RepID=UPI001E4AB1B5|nr:NAD(P)H-dependent oxidoreductase [Staphylococcus chromogenes]MCD8905305.1 NAD(P)H-dependent oxidoreductase [Staphylococcus chromogenes]UXS67186.1 NAD(P)H-dependent oxidoreductase [Staphylococcus chromogenes]